MACYEPPKTCLDWAKDLSSRLQEAVGKPVMPRNEVLCLTCFLARFIFIMPSPVYRMFLVLIGALLGLATAQQAIQDPVTAFCRRHQHQTCVIDSKLYVDGGEVYYGSAVDSNSRPQMSE
jgi:hypothetical protein